MASSAGEQFLDLRLSGLPDLTQGVDNETALCLLSGIVLAMCEADDIDAALGVAVECICTATQWDSGQAWLVDDDGGARSSRTIAFPPCCTIRIGVLAGDETIAIMEFIHHQATPQDASIAQAVADVAARLGPLVRRIISDDARKCEAERLQRTCSELEHFALVASHDLQEPLSALSYFMQVLRRQSQHRLDQDGQELIDLVLDNTARMQTLVRELLSLSRLPTQAPTVESTDVTATLADVLRNLRGVIAKTGARVTHEPLPVVQADKREVGQLFQNLVGNAIKYQHPGAQPRVHVRALPEGSAWRFDVEDNGIGIAASDSERIFEAFHRLHTRDEYDGTGLGLAICKKIVERHGGRIWAHPAQGQGSVVSFTLPVDMRTTHA